MVNSGNAALGGLLSGLGSTGGAGNLGGVFGAKASPYLGAVLRGITSGANFQQPNPTPPASSGTFLPQSSQMRYPFTQPTWIPPRQAPPGMAPESWQKGWNIQYAQPDQMQYLPQQGSFDEQAYLQMYPDVAASVKAGLTPSGLWHYQNYGKTEGRSLPGNAMAQSAAGPAVGGTAMSGTAANGMPSNQQDFISMLMSGGLSQA